jgi:hypothetical protein
LPYLIFSEGKGKGFFHFHHFFNDFDVALKKASMGVVLLLHKTDE